MCFSALYHSYCTKIYMRLSKKNCPVNFCKLQAYFMIHKLRQYIKILEEFNISSRLSLKKHPHLIRGYYRDRHIKYVKRFNSC